jgi:hypothetical protein
MNTATAIGEEPFHQYSTEAASSTAAALRTNSSLLSGFLHPQQQQQQQHGQQIRLPNGQQEQIEPPPTAASQHSLSLADELSNEMMAVAAWANRSAGNIIQSPQPAADLLGRAMQRRQTGLQAFSHWAYLTTGGLPIKDALAAARSGQHPLVAALQRRRALSSGVVSAGARRMLAHC